MENYSTLLFPAGMSTLGLYSEDIVPEISTFSGFPEVKFNTNIRSFYNKAMVITMT